jgi:hypothetical protein
MGKALFYLIVFAGLSICAQGSASVHGEDTRPADATQALIIELSIPAPLPEVWRAFTTNEGLSSWLAPEMSVGFKERRQLVSKILRLHGRWHHRQLCAAEGTGPQCACARSLPARSRRSNPRGIHLHSEREQHPGALVANGLASRQGVGCGL